VTGAYLSFEGCVVPVDWGRATYTVLPLPEPVAAALTAAGARRVEGEIAEHPVNLALSRAPVVEGLFLWAGQSLLDRIGIAPGEPVEVRLRPAPDDRVEVPPDVAAALTSAGATGAWEGLTPGRRRGLLYQIETAKRPETRAKRISGLIDGISAGATGQRA
jgi:hypothetical protein